MKVSLLTFVGFVVFIASETESRVPENPLTDINDPTDTKPQTNNDLGIEENINDVLKEDDDETDVFIPSLKQLTTESNPVELGKEIKKITDPARRKELIAELKKARNENRDTLPGKFYKAALTAIKNEEKATNDWANELDNATKSLLNSGTNLAGSVGDMSNVIGNAGSIGGMSNVIGNARTLVRINPLGIAQKRGESVLLTMLSDASKNIGKFSDSVYDTAGDVFGMNKKLTQPLQRVPFVGEVKDNVDEAIDDHLKRGRFVVGSFADAGAETFAKLAKDSATKANEKGELMKQFYNSS